MTDPLYAPSAVAAIPPSEGGVEPSSTGGAAPAAPEKAQPVAGKWAYLSTDKAIYCDDFSSDARLMLIGDFATESERTKYGDRIAAMLNAAPVAHVAVAGTREAPPLATGDAPLVTVREDVVRFLLGEGPLENVWWGEPNHARDALYWWRNPLRLSIHPYSLPSAITANEDSRDAARYRWFKANSRQAAMMGERPFWTTNFTLDGNLEFDKAIDAQMDTSDSGSERGGRGT